MASDLGALAQFTAGYLLILITPGPNLIAIASTAAVRGLRAALPFCAGIASGAGCLCATVAFAADAARWGELGTARLAGACLLACVALSTARRRVGPPGPAAPSTAQDVAVLGAGFLTASTNPLTAAYFLSAFLQFSPTWHWRAAAIVSVLAAALLVYPAIAGALARPALRRLVLRGGYSLRLVTALVLALTAARTAWPVIFPS